MPPPPCRFSPPLHPGCLTSADPLAARQRQASPHLSPALFLTACRAPSFNPLPEADDLAQEMEDVDFEEEEEEEEGNEEGWVLEPQEGVVGSMEGPDDSEVTFALHSGRSLRRSVRNSVQVGI